MLNENNHQLRYLAHEEHQHDPEAKNDVLWKLKHHNAGCGGAYESSPKDGHQTGQ